MKFNEIFPEFEAGKSIRRKSWPPNMCYSKNDNFTLSAADIIGDANDWEVWKPSSYDEFLDEMKQYLYYELEFYKSSQACHYPEENMELFDIWTVINDYCLTDDVINKLLRYIKDNNLAKKF